MPSIDALDDDSYAIITEDKCKEPIEGQDAPEMEARSDDTMTDVSVFDPWAISEGANADETKGEIVPDPTSLYSRWSSLRDRIQTQWQATPVQNEDEATVVVERATLVVAAKKGKLLEPEPHQPAAIIDPSKISAEDVPFLRASRMSVTLQTEAQDSTWGLGLEQADDKVRIKAMANMGLLERAPFQVGDILVSVNNRNCTNAEVALQELVTIDRGAPVTLLVENPQGSTNLVQALVRKSSPDDNLGIGFYVPADVQEQDIKIPLAVLESVDPNAAQVGDAEHAEETDARTEAVSITSAPVNDDPFGHLLKVNNIDPRGLLALSALSQGDIVVAINGTLCSHLKPEEATLLLFQSPDTVTITAMKPPAESDSLLQRWLRQAKRASTVGLGFVPTLPSIIRRRVAQGLDEGVRDGTEEEKKRDGTDSDNTTEIADRNSTLANEVTRADDA
jgi:PDZ domain